MRRLSFDELDARRTIRLSIHRAVQVALGLVDAGSKAELRPSVRHACGPLRAVVIGRTSIEPTVSTFELRQTFTALDALRATVARSPDTEPIGFGAGSIVIITTGDQQRRDADAQ